MVLATSGSAPTIVAGVTEVTWHLQSESHQPGSHPVLCVLPPEGRGRARGLLLALPVKPKSPSESGFGDPLSVIRELGYVERAHVVVCLPTFEHEPWIADRRNSSAATSEPHPEQWFMYPGRPAQQQEAYVLDVLLPFVRRKVDSMGIGFAPAAPVSLLSFSKGGFAAFSLLARHHRVFWQAAVWDAPMMLGGSFCEFLADARRGNTDTWGMRASFEDCDTWRAYAPIDILRAESFPRALRRRPRDGQQPRIALYGSNYFGPHPTAFSIMPARSQTAMETPSAHTRTMWQQKHMIPGEPFSHTVDFHRALLEHHVPHVYNNSLPGPHRWNAAWMRPALDFFEWSPRKEAEDDGGGAPAEAEPPHDPPPSATQQQARPQWSLLQQQAQEQPPPENSPHQRGALAADLVVYDATSGGVIAAVAAARRGVSVLLLCASWPACFEHGGRQVGGMSSSGLGMTDSCLPIDRGRVSNEIGGLAYEFYARNRRKYADAAAPDALDPVASGTVAKLWMAGDEHTHNGRRLLGDISARMGGCQLPAAHCNVTWNLEPHVARQVFEDMITESGVRVVYEAQVDRVHRVGRRIHSLTLTSGVHVVGKAFVEASYEGDFLAAARVSTAVGRESMAKYGESLAGVRPGSTAHQFRGRVDAMASDGSGRTLPLVEEVNDGLHLGAADRRVPSYNFRLCVTTNPNASIPFGALKPAGYDPGRWELLRRTAAQLKYDRPSCNTRAIPNGKYDMNNCGPVSTDFIGASGAYPNATYAERRAIWHEHREYVQGLLYTLATDSACHAHGARLSRAWGLCADEFVATQGMPPSLYVREARRLVGDRVFHQNTPKEKRRKGGTSAEDDTVALGCYPFDSHATRRVVCRSGSRQCLGHGHINGSGTTTSQEGSKGAAVHFAWNEGEVTFKYGPYRIPFWALLPKRDEVVNVLAVSTPSASHIGFSSIRMEPQFMLLGHAAGVAVALALQNATAARRARGPAAHSGERGGEASAGEGMEDGPAVDFHVLPRGALEAALRADGAKLDPVVNQPSNDPGT